MSDLTASIELMFEDLDVKALESELVTLAGHLAAGTCRMLQLLAEFDARQGWAGPGLLSCAHWLNWRVGMSLRTARDHLRVAHALSNYRPPPPRSPPAGSPTRRCGRSPASPAPTASTPC
jgi:hypothetical protein